MINSQTGKPDPKANQLWRHYKGGTYLVLEVVLRESDRAPMVVYKSTSEDQRHGWVRPLGEFMDKFTFDSEVTCASALHEADSMQLVNARRLIAEAQELLGML